MKSIVETLIGLFGNPSRFFKEMTILALATAAATIRGPAAMRGLF